MKRLAKFLWKTLPLGLGALALTLALTIYAYPVAIQSVAGLAVAQSSTLWNSLRDAAVGDNQTNGLGAFVLYGYDGATFDRIRGNAVDGLDVRITSASTLTVTGTAANNADSIAPTATGNVPTASYCFGFNGATTVWDRCRLAVTGDDLGGAILGVQPYGFDVAGTNFDRIPTFANGDAVTTTNFPRGLGQAALGYGWNGTTYDRLRSTSNAADGVATTTTGNRNSLSFILGWNGTTFDRVRALANNADDVAVSTTGNLSAQAFNYEFDGTTYDRVRHSFSQSTASITGNGAGTTLVMTTTPMSDHTMQIDRTAGTTDAVEIDLECSLDGTDFTQIATITSLVGEPVIATAVDTPCPQIRYNVVTVGAGNTLQIHLIDTR